MVEQQGPPVSPEWAPVYHDGNPAWIIRIADDDGATVVDLVYADGRNKWCYWPSPRIQARPADIMT